MKFNKMDIIQSSSFIFGADAVKCYAKLKEGQFSKPLDGLVREPLSNALDARRGEHPIRINLESRRNCAVLTFVDNGDGLTKENLSAFHVIGRSSKRNVQGKIGRFGMGMIGVFHSELCVFKVEITSRMGGVDGRPVRVVIDAHPDSACMPQWRYEEISEEVDTGLSIAFHFPLTVTNKVKKAMDALVEKMVVPIVWQETNYCWKPDTLRKNKKDILLSVGTKPTVQVHYAKHRQEYYEFYNRAGISVYLHGMPVVDLPGCEVLGSLSEMYDLPNNFTVPWVFSREENAVVLSLIGEPTVGRDSIVKNDDWKLICSSICDARMDAITKIIDLARKEGTTHNNNGTLWEHATNLAWANMRTCRGIIVSYLKQESLSSEYAMRFAESICNFPCFTTLAGDVLSLSEIVKSFVPCNTFAASRSGDSALGAGATYSGSFVLKNNDPHTYIFGLHLHNIVDDLISPILKELGYRVIILSAHIRRDKDRFEELLQTGVLREKKYEFKKIIPEKLAADFLESIKEKLNQRWFSRALGMDYARCRIRLHPVSCIHEYDAKNVLAMNMGEGSNIDEINVAINVKSKFFLSIASSKNAGALYAFLPLLVHEISHRSGSEQGEENESHSMLFYYNMLSLGDRVVTHCVSNLLGNTEDNNYAQDETEGVIVV